MELRPGWRAVARHRCNPRESEARRGSPKSGLQVGDAQWRPAAVMVAGAEVSLS